MSAQRNEPRRSVSLKERVLSVPTLVSFGVAGAFIFLLATRFDVDWATTWANVRAINPWLYAVAIISYYISFGFRGLRWRILAENANVGQERASNIPTAARFAQLIVIGWFEGETLVVDTAFFAPAQWGNGSGVSSSEQKRLTERFTLLDDGRRMRLEYSIEDPVYLTESVMLSQTFGLDSGYPYQDDYDCDPEASSRHLIE